MFTTALGGVFCCYPCFFEAKTIPNVNEGGGAPRSLLYHLWECNDTTILKKM